MADVDEATKPEAADSGERLAPARGSPSSRSNRPATGRGVEAEEAPAEDQPSLGKPGERSDAPSLWRTLAGHPVPTGIVLLILCVGVAAGLWWWLATRDFESTDDAFIDARPVAISALVAGQIAEAPVTDNQLVAAGAVLARIDPRDYQASQAQAQAQIDQAQAGVANAVAQVDTQQARIEQATKQVAEAQAALNFSKDENARYQNLVQQGAGTVQRAQQASSDLQGKQAALDAANAGLAEAHKQNEVLHAQMATAQAQLKQAQAQSAAAAANLSRVVLTAPVEGRVTKLTGAVGAYAAPGQTLMILVPTQMWVTANFKETQLAQMRPGQPVEIEIDAYGRKFPGHVDSLQAGSGTAFSLLPAENATGNYVKVVQRVPVKIVFDRTPDVAIGPGLSVAPSVKVR